MGSTSPTHTNLARVQPVRGLIRGPFGAENFVHPQPQILANPSQAILVFPTKNTNRFFSYNTIIMICFSVVLSAFLLALELAKFATTLDSLFCCNASSLPLSISDA